MKKLVSILSVCLIFISCFAFNASAEDPIIDTPVANYPVYYANCRDVYDRYIKDQSFNGFSFDSLKYVYTYGSYGKFYFFPPDISFEVGFPRVNQYGYLDFGSIDQDYSTSLNKLAFIDSSGSYTVLSPNNYSGLDKGTIYYSSFTIYDYNGEPVIEPPSSGIPDPYTITYNPNLSLNMERESELMTINTVDVTVHLNKDFIDWYIKRAYEAGIPTGNNNFGAAEDLSISEILSSESGQAVSINLANCGRSESLFFITSSSVNDVLYDCTNSTVYTYMSDQRYSIVDKQSGQIDGSTSTAVYANGYYPYFDLAFEQLSSLTSLSLSQYNSIINSDISYTFTVDLRQINWPQIMQNRQTNGLENIDFPLECVLTSNVRYLPDGNDDYDTAFNEFYGFTSNGYDSDTGQSQTSFGNLFDTFSTESSYSDHILKEGLKDSPWYIYTKDFSFTDSLPDYVPLKDSEGNDLDVSGNSGNLAKNPPKPTSYQSVDLNGNLSDKRTEQEQLAYDRSFRISQDFADHDFSLSDILSILNPDSDLFKFFTSFLNLLPPIFITIFCAFFLCVLIIFIIKFVVS